MTTEMESKNASRTWRNFLAHETFEYCFNFAFLSLFLVAFAWYRRLILAAYHIEYSDYWMPLIEAAILAKVVMLGEALRVGQRFRDRPLAVVTVYRTVVFSLLVGLFSLLEHIVGAVVHGKSIAEGMATIADQGKDEVLGACLVIFAAFLPFFAMKEIERVFGTERVRGLLFQRGTDDAEARPANGGEAAK